MKKILVFAQDGDITADDVSHWIRHLQPLPVLRINDTDKIELVDLQICSGNNSRFTIRINEGLTIRSIDIHAYWYRRGNLSYPDLGIKSMQTGSSAIWQSLYTSMNRYYRKEWEHVTSFIHYLLKSIGIRSLNSFFDLECNKLTNLEKAKRAGLKIPESIVTNDAEEIKSFLVNHKQVITKPVRSPGSSYELNNYEVCYSQSTNLFTMADLESILSERKHFQPTHFQEYINKEFEIRSFYLKGTFYSMSIFSQSNPKTVVDFRSYDKMYPNRNVPFLLPKNIEQKLCVLMQEIGYDTGSIDLIFNGDDYYFLEVNPTGQLKWLSRNCNYHVEKNIASFIVN